MLTPTKDKAADPAAPAAAGVLAPFVRGSRQRTEPFHDVSHSLTTSAQQSGPHDVVARGFMRNIVLEVTLSGGDGSTTPAVVAEDAPFSVLDQVTLHDPNGSPIVQLDGYSLFLANKYGAYAGIADPRRLPSFVGTDSDGDLKFVVRIPVEISARDAFGSLANQSASTTYKLSYTLAGSGSVFDTLPVPTVPSVRVKAWLESWSQPPATDLLGNAIEPTPPALGTVQQWSKSVYNVSSGDQTIRLSRVGNHIRTILAVFRNSSAARNTTNLPDPITFRYDGNDLDSIGRGVLLDRIAERHVLDGSDDAAAGLDTGVIEFGFHHDLDGVAGAERRALYLPTHQGTDLELRGSFGADGTLTVLTNDVAVNGGLYAA